MVNRRLFRPGFPDVKEQPPQRISHNGPAPVGAARPFSAVPEPVGAAIGINRPS